VDWFFSVALMIMAVGLAAVAGRAAYRMYERAR
jgi:hypothetical protein